MTMLLLLSLACNSDAPTGANGIDGIWLLQLAYAEDDGCDTAINHNFQDSYELGDGPWTETWLRDHSDALLLAQVAQLDSENAVLVIGTQVWPGTGADGKWTFTWTATDSVQYGNEHDEGYVYGETIERTDVNTLTLTVDGDAASGKWEASLDETISYSESDLWDVQVGLGVGEIPSDQYLGFSVGDNDDIPRTNTIDDSECSDSRCTLDVQTTCSGESSVKATRTGYLDQGAYDQLEDVARPYGTGS